MLMMVFKIMTIQQWDLVSELDDCDDHNDDDYDDHYAYNGHQDYHDAFDGVYDNPIVPGI